MSNPNFTLTHTIEEYNKELQAQNIAKIQEIQLLKREMDLALLSSRLQALNTDHSCKECARKQQQIDTLIKAIKSLRTSTSTGSRQTLKIAQQGNQGLSPRNQSEIEQAMHTELQKRLQLNSHEQILEKFHSKEVFSIESSSAEIERLREQNKLYLQEIDSLRKKLNMCQKKLLILEDTNRTLRRQIKVKPHQSLQLSNYGLESYHKAVQPPQPTPEDIRKRIPTFSAIRSTVTKSSATQPPPSNKRHSRMAQLKQEHRSKDRTHVRYDSPLLVLEKQKAKDSGRTKYKSIDEDLVDQRKRSLDRKIRILESQNKKLRSEMYVLSN